MELLVPLQTEIDSGALPIGAAIGLLISLVIAGGAGYYVEEPEAPGVDAEAEW